MGRLKLGLLGTDGEGTTGDGREANTVDDLGEMVRSMPEVERERVVGEEGEAEREREGDAGTRPVGCERVMDGEGEAAVVLADSTVDMRLFELDECARAASGRDGKQGTRWTLRARGRATHAAGQRSEPCCGRVESVLREANLHSRRRRQATQRTAPASAAKPTRPPSSPDHSSWSEGLARWQVHRI